ncbi:DNA primase [hydrothermal vent metagenome]|uniref:DNA primase n=1 Tax=hydrothermal vent metagenome TaxID=652676 RepID=A0A3B1B513_9ZZZZ
MAGYIPPHFIDELLTRVDIVDVIDGRVALRKAGREYAACCPFHNEKTPSFTVSREKQFYHCFGCGVHGSAIGFLMEYEHMDFAEAVEELAGAIGLEVPYEAGSSAPSADRGNQDLYEVLGRVADYYCQQLRQHPQAQRAQDYLKGRGLSGEIAAEFELGFAPPGWDNLTAALDVKAECLLTAGMLIRKDSGGHYDRFRERIMFPIRDRRGRVIGFGGRVMGGEDNTPGDANVAEARKAGATGPKYLNSPETPVFHKGSELYGLYQARKAVRKLERLLVVEGYMDVVSLAQFGVRNVVATLGTATTTEHLQRLFRVVPQVVFCFDGDRAGREAAWRALENALSVLSEGRQIRFMFLPDGEDPDSLVRKEGQAGFEQRLENASPFSRYFFEALSGRVDLGSIDGRAQLVELARPLLKKLPQGVLRHMMATQLAEVARLDAAALADLTGVPRPEARLKRPAPAAGTSPVRRAIRLLLQRPQLVEGLMELDTLRGLELPGVPLLQAMIDLLRTSPHLSCGAILEHWRGQDEGRHLARLAQLPVDVPDDGLAVEFSDVMAHIASLYDEQALDRLLAKSRLGDLSDEEKYQLKQSLATRGGSSA